MICSSVSMVKAYAAVVDGDIPGLKKWLVLTVLVGAAFVGVQGFEYFTLTQHEHFLPSSGLFGATFYTMTGFHGFHVTVGVICMIWVTVKAFRGGYTQQNHYGVEVVGLYWVGSMSSRRVVSSDSVCKGSLTVRLTSSKSALAKRRFTVTIMLAAWEASLRSSRSTRDA